MDKQTNRISQLRASKVGVLLNSTRLGTNKHNNDIHRPNGLEHYGANNVGPIAVYRFVPRVGVSGVPHT